MNYFGLTTSQIIATALGWVLGLALAVECIEPSSVFRGVILPVSIGIPIALFAMLIGSEID